MTQAEFETRIIAMQDTLYRVSATLLTQMCDREDAIQECIYKALAKREKLKSDDAMQAWIVRILINECYQQMRRRKRLIPMETPPEGEVEPGADADVRQALMRLKPELRVPLVLRYIEGYKVEEIAAILRLPAGTVKSRLSRGRRALRIEWDEEEERAVQI